MRCIRCGQHLSGQGYGFQVGRHTFGKCLGCGPFSEAEKLAVVQHLTRSAPPPPNRPCACKAKR